MSIAFCCDAPGCSRTLDRYDARIELNEIEDTHEPTPTPDDDEFTELVGVPLLRIGAEACDRHFCGLACLAAWAMREDIDRSAS